jgi:hypothetical protein
MNFAAAADQLRRQEYARLAATITPTLAAIRTLTPAPLREQILGHTIITSICDQPQNTEVRQV